MFTSSDHAFMTRALELARQGLQTATPNPRVGCVIVRDGQIVGEGWHRRAGEPHAEIVALGEAAGRARGATVYVTLEPCSHFGRTPPCVDALVDAKVGRVIAAMEDPNPKVNGRGLGRLRGAGIDVRCGLLQHEATELNIGFVSRMARGRPWVRLKVAASLDGLTALPDGSSQWITGEPARRDGHAWRARACAILTGIGTVRDDDPQLDVRLVETSRQPFKVVVDSRLEIDLEAKVLKGASAWIACAVDDPDKTRELRERGCEVIRLPGPQGKVDLAALMGELAGRGINEVHVEAGHKLNGSLVRAGVVDELLLYVAPSLLGEGLGMFGLDAPPDLDRRRLLRFTDVERLGQDLRVMARF
ncbi:MAG TPA: bifunctional diaminohydroxyphosphoribosylaminopyrimidine deaminase/5-amino-6-(5-phosphoribosylamino)uracil reductase RibD [Burkholderiaceae bacterium]|nr:bifunctional diaminohydroxyphosphoribosylaminopyrimidine deaminase/5-amino-6-(5-phosphoribosylamino)uracil reductase RibD [Burkholderiaceae bacterium]